MQITDLPHVNVSLNVTSAILLTAGYVAIRTRRVTLHKALMLSALATTAAFLTCYLIYHFSVPPKPYTGQGAMRVVFGAVLYSHVFLAACNFPMIIITAMRALRGQYERHRRIARLVLPVWWYVSVTGVMVYFMLY